MEAIPHNGPRLLLGLHGGTQPRGTLNYAFLRSQTTFDSDRQRSRTRTSSSSLEISIGIVGGSVFPASKQDTDPFKGQGAHGDVVIFASGDLGLVVGLSPGQKRIECVANS